MLMGDIETKNLLALFKAGSHSMLQEQARRLLDLEAECGFMWKLFAASLAVSGKWQEALPAMRRACELMPEDAEVFANRGLAAFEVGLFQESLDSCKRALSLDSQCMSAWSTLGILLRHEGRIEESLQHQLKALSLAPGSAQAHGNLGVIYKELGRFEASIHHFRQALILQFDQLRVLPKELLPTGSRGPGRPVMSREGAYRALDELRAVLDAVEIPWCLVAGTILGIHRDGDLLPNDKDLDIAIPAFVEGRRLASVFASESRFALVPQVAIPAGERNRYSMSFVHQTTGVTLDIFFMHAEGEAHYLMGMDHPGLPMLARIRRFSIGKQSWRGRDWPAPSPIEDYLEDIYGLGWVRPDPGFDTVLSNPNRTQASMPATLCYGYSCLNARLMEKNWAKSKSYCSQLLRRLQDPLVRDLESWLEQVASTP